MTVKTKSLHHRKTKQIIREFSKKDHESFIKQYKSHIKRFGTIDSEKDRNQFPELIGWTLYIRNNLEKLPWSLIEQLVDIKFFPAKETVWLKHFASLRIFHQVFGHTRVPARWAKNKKLASWLHRHRNPQPKVSPEQRALMDSLGFEWRLRPTYQKTPWQTHYQELIAYKKEYGDCNVPAKWASNRTLGSWVSYQRLHKKLLSDEQVEALDKIDFSWDILSDQWEHMYQQLKAFKKEFGHCNVPHKNSSYKKLGTWVSNVRVRTQLLTPQRKKRLDKLGFSWNPDEDTWQKKYQELIAFKEKHQHANVPSTHHNRTLACWVVNNRQKYKKDKLSRRYIEQLEAIGFVWDPNEKLWEDRYREWQQFTKKHGHPYVPVKRYTANPVLDNWLRSQRSKWDTLSPDRQARMLQTGWDPSKTSP